MTERLVRVFLSHTSELAELPDGRSFVQAALDAISRASLVSVDMRYFAARDTMPAEYCRDRVRQCDIYVGLIGFRYGSLVPGEAISYTELEFEEAGAAGIPRLLFLWDTGSEPSAMVADGDQAAIDGFRQRVSDGGLLWRGFTDASSLELEVYLALSELVDVRRLPPRQLPANASAFAGRDAELRQLESMLTAGRQPGSSLVCLLSGSAGVGKTALAVRWAHSVSHRFPDGQLFVDLRGYDPDLPLASADALAALLRGLGDGGADIPDDPAERAARYRTLLARKRALIVLDNASSADQVRPLLPGGGLCCTVVTSRDSLAALVAREGAQRIDLGLLQPGEAVSLLRLLIGSRVDSEPQAAAILADQCARLPLALRVCAELAAARPSAGLAALTGELADERARLALLDADGDPRTGVTAVFSWSVRQLAEPLARVFRLLGVYPGLDVQAAACAALAATTEADAQRMLDQLARAHLVQPFADRRYQTHDLLRAYARRLAEEQDQEPQRKAALNRLFDYHMATSATAMDALFPAERHRRPSQDAAEASGAEVMPLADARGWLDTERPNLIACAIYAADHGWPDHAGQLAAVLGRYLFAGAYYSDALTVHRRVLAAARISGDRLREARSLGSLANLCWQHARYAEAIDHHEQALELYQDLGERGAQARTLANIGMVYERLGRFRQAGDNLQRSLQVLRELQDQHAVVRVLSSLSGVYFQLGRYAQAEALLGEALQLSREAGDLVGQARALDNLGIVHCQLGRHREAANSHEQALALFRSIGDRAGEAGALDNLGVAVCHTGKFEEAIDRHDNALALFREIGDTAGEANSLMNLGTVHRHRGRIEEALAHHEQALSLFRGIGTRGEEAATLCELGADLAALGQLSEASTKYHAALTLALQLEDRYAQAMAHLGLARTLNDTQDPLKHRQAAHAIHAELGLNTPLPPQK